MIDLPKKYSNILKDFKYIDLFAGIGGFRLALDSFGAKCVFTSEWDKHSQDVYIKNFGDEPNGDIT
ncbi:DNA cytosine methyltransferase, partial [Gammaproteobacteria bacterium]|nr:DNA cytosine methyltransferase [Gammaproteobacteria bacterium]